MQRKGLRKGCTRCTTLQQLLYLQFYRGPLSPWLVIVELRYHSAGVAVTASALTSLSSARPALFWLECFSSSSFAIRHATVDSFFAQAQWLELQAFMQPQAATSNASLASPWHSPYSVLLGVRVCSMQVPTVCQVRLASMPAPVMQRSTQRCTTWPAAMLSWVRRQQR
jgi:hypothetical protein